MNDPQLFDPARTTVTLCPVCQATRQPGEQRAPGCTVDRDRDTGQWPRRPIGCLNTHDPARAEIPY
jgi:hypothetical protein